MFDIKYWRLKRNLTRIQLALLLGTTRGYIYEIETGRKSPSMQIINKLLEILEIRIIVKDLREECEDFIESEVGELLAWKPSNK